MVKNNIYNGIKQKLAPGLYIVVFHFLINENNNTVKVMKSVYLIQILMVDYSCHNKHLLLFFH